MSDPTHRPGPQGSPPRMPVAHLPERLNPVYTSDGVRIDFDRTPVDPHRWLLRLATGVAVACAMWVGGYLVIGAEFSWPFGILTATVLSIGVAVQLARLYDWMQKPPVSNRELRITDHGVWANGIGGSWQEVQRCEVGFDREGGARLELEFTGGRTVHLPAEEVLVEHLEELTSYIEELRADGVVADEAADGIRRQAASLRPKST